MGDGRLGQAEWLSQVADPRLATFVRGVAGLISEYRRAA